MPKPRRTRDEWTIQGNYGCGWEDVSAYDDPVDAADDLRRYREAEPDYGHRLVLRRIRIATGPVVFPGQLTTENATA